MTSIKISAILPNYNCARFLPKSMQSLVDQTEPFTEIIIVDDGSTDESLSVIDGFMQKYDNIRLIKHEKNQGVSCALNTGLNNAVGDYVMLCAADDRYHPNSVARGKEVIKQFPSVGLVCGDAIVQRFDLKSPFYRALPYEKNRLISAEEFKSMARKKHVGFNSGGSMFIRKTAVFAAGLLHAPLRWHSDWLLYFAVALREGFYYTGEPFIYINMRNEAYSRGKHNWKIQKQVMIDTIKVLADYFPDVWNDFKEAALLPDYDIRYIFLFLMYSKSRRFLTLLLLWKCIINNAIVTRIGRLFPYRVILKMRKFLRA